VPLSVPPAATEKKPTKKREATLDSVLSTVKRGFANLEGKIDQGFAAVADDIARTDSRVEKLDAKIDSVESNLAGKINRLDSKLTKFEEREIDKRLQLEVRVSAIEKHLGLEKGRRLTSGATPSPASARTTKSVL
jgi:hypothetical protein